MSVPCLVSLSLIYFCPTCELCDCIVIVIFLLPCIYCRSVDLFSWHFCRFFDRASACLTVSVNGKFDSDYTFIDSAYYIFFSFLVNILITTCGRLAGLFWERKLTFSFFKDELFFFFQWSVVCLFSFSLCCEYLSIVVYWLYSLCREQWSIVCPSVRTSYCKRVCIVCLTVIVEELRVCGCKCMLSPFFCILSKFFFHVINHSDKALSHNVCFLNNLFLFSLYSEKKS